MDLKPRPNHQAYLQALRRMSDEEKLNKAFELSAFGKELFLAGLRERFPAAAEDEIRRLYLERLRLCPQPELLKRVVEALDRVGVPYAVTGSVVSSIQGEPRSSHDIDILVALRPEALPAVLAAFPEPDFLLQADAARDAIRTGGMFNLIWIPEGDKVDFWLLTDDPFDRSRFGRRRVSRVWGMDLQVTSPEDTILAKLRWSKLSGGSTKQYGDALRVYEVQYGTLDLAYLASWANRLGVADEWRRLTGEAKPLQLPGGGTGG